jgi:glucose uptake protein GlcU
VSERYDGDPPPETRLANGKVGAILVPIGLFWFAFTTYPSIHYLVPITASVLFGAGIFFAFTSTSTYLVTAYRPVSASAMASHVWLRGVFAAAFPLFAGGMYHRMGTVGASALLAGLTVLLAPLPFVFDRYGKRLREKSRFAVS